MFRFVLLERLWVPQLDPYSDLIEDFLVVGSILAALATTRVVAVQTISKAKAKQFLAPRFFATARCLFCSRVFVQMTALEYFKLLLDLLNSLYCLLTETSEHLSTLGDLVLVIFQHG